MARGRKKDTKKRATALAAYKRLGELKLVSEELGIDRSQLGKWAKEENWDEELALVRQEVGRRLRVGELEDQVDLDLTADEVVNNIKRFRALALEGLEAVSEGKVKFTKMGDVLRVLKMYDDVLRLQLGEPTQRVNTNHTVHLAGVPQDRSVAVHTLISIAQSSQEHDGFIDVTPEDEPAGALTEGEA